ncbi:MAG TPA: flagellar hook-basal body complex protein FliE [Terriglobales bacterium]|nr:flagellar hook-basal body complex protein FliE [Terriglobales bacterium]
MSNNIPALRILPADIDSFPSQRIGRGESSFSEMLDEAVFHVDQLQADATEKVTATLGGDVSDVHDAMIAVQKADLSFQLMMQVRNKVIQAYQDVERMQF